MLAWRIIARRLSQPGSGYLYNSGMRWLRSALLFWVTALLGATLEAQQMMPVGVVRGSLVTWLGGSLSVRSADGTVYDCSYDKHTLFQRNLWPIQSADLSGGEPVEVVSDRKLPTRTCYVRMLSVVYISPKSPRRSVPKREVWTPRGYLTYSGLVVKSDESKITLKTRNGSRTLLLSARTLYSAAAEPLLNKHVFVRAGRNLEGALEAYQVMWGEILNPGQYTSLPERNFLQGASSGR